MFRLSHESDELGSGEPERQVSICGGRRERWIDDCVARNLKPQGLEKYRHISNRIEMHLAILSVSQVRSLAPHGVNPLFRDLALHWLIVPW
jgi:hypothetical protein